LDLVRGLAHARSRDLTRESDISLDLALVLDLAFALDLARDLARNLDLPHDLTLDLTRARSYVFNLTCNLARDLAYVCNLVRKLTFILTRARDLARSSAGDCARDLTCALALNLFLTPDRDFALVRDLTLVRDLGLTLDFALDLAHNRVRARTEDLSRALGLILGRKPNVFLDPARQLGVEWPDVADFLRWYVRLTVLLLAEALLGKLSPKKPKSWLSRLGATDQKKRIQIYWEMRRLTNYQDLYIDFVLLEERVQGNLPAIEGIRIVKERKRMAK
jgi:hypothetical protein